MRWSSKVKVLSASGVREDRGIAEQLPALLCVLATVSVNNNQLRRAGDYSGRAALNFIAGRLCHQALKNLATTEKPRRVGPPVS
jgi:hypothetical protein